MQPIKSILVLVSAYQSNAILADNLEAHYSLSQELAKLDLNAIQADSRWGNKPEQSFCVVKPNYLPEASFIAIMLGLAAKYRQEAILVRHQDGTASCYGVDGKNKYLGVFREITPSHAKAMASYTKINGVYYYAG